MEGERIASVALRPRAGVSLAWSAEVRGDERSKEDFFFLCVVRLLCAETNRFRRHLPSLLMSVVTPIRRITLFFFLYIIYNFLEFCFISGKKRLHRGLEKPQKRHNQKKNRLTYTPLNNFRKNRSSSKRDAAGY
jgi:hypothetical protein